MAEISILDIAVNKLGLPISEEGALDRLDWPRATSAEDRIKGEAVAVAKGGALIPSGKAAEEDGVVNPDEAALKAADAKVAEEPKKQQELALGSAGKRKGRPRKKP